MTKIAIFLVICLAIFLPSAFSNELDPVTKSAKFDYLILRHIWPASTCMFPGSHSVIKKKLKLNLQFFIVSKVIQLPYYGIRTEMPPL